MSVTRRLRKPLRTLRSRGGGNDLWLVISRTTAAVDDQPDVAKPQHRRRALAQHRPAEDIAIEGRRSPDVFDDDRMCHDELELTTLIGLRHGDLLFDRARLRSVWLPPISRWRLREGAVLFAAIEAPPMNLLGPELVRDLVSLNFLG